MLGQDPPTPKMLPVTNVPAPQISREGGITDPTSFLPSLRTRCGLACSQPWRSQDKEVVTVSGRASSVIPAQSGGCRRLGGGRQ